MDVRAVSQGRQDLSNYSGSSLETIQETQKFDNQQPHSQEPAYGQQSNSNKIPSEKEVKMAVEKFNKLLEDKQTHIEYEQDEPFKSIMIMKVVDNETKRVIKEIPSKQILDMVAQFCEMAGLILDKKA